MKEGRKKMKEGREEGGSGLYPSPFEPGFIIDLLIKVMKICGISSHLISQSPSLSRYLCLVLEFLVNF